MMVSLVASGFRPDWCLKRGWLGSPLLRSSVDQRQGCMRNVVASVTKANVPNNKRLHFQPNSYTVPCSWEKNQKFKLCEVHLINPCEVPHLLLGIIYPNVKNVTRHRKPLLNRLKSHKASFLSAFSPESEWEINTCFIIKSAPVKQINLLRNLKDRRSLNSLLDSLYPNLLPSRTLACISFFQQRPF